MPFDASALFFSPLPHRQNMRTFFIWGDKKKLLRARLREWGGWETGGDIMFGQKLLNTQCDMGRCARKLPYHEMGKHNERMLKKKLTEAECSLSQQYQLAH